MGDYVFYMIQQDKIQPIAPVGRPGKWVKYHSRVVFTFFVCDHNFCSRPETEPENQSLHCLIHRMLIPGYCIPKGIKLQNVSDFPNFYPSPQRGVNRHFQA